MAQSWLVNQGIGATPNLAQRVVDHPGVRGQHPPPDDGQDDHRHDHREKVNAAKELPTRQPLIEQGGGEQPEEDREGHWHDQVDGGIAERLKEERVAHQLGEVLRPDELHLIGQNVPVTDAAEEGKEEGVDREERQVDKPGQGGTAARPGPIARSGGLLRRARRRQFAATQWCSWPAPVAVGSRHRCHVSHPLPRRSRSCTAHGGAWRRMRDAAGLPTWRLPATPCMPACSSPAIWLSPPAGWPAAR